MVDTRYSDGRSGMPDAGVRLRMSGSAVPHHLVRQ